LHICDFVPNAPKHSKLALIAFTPWKVDPQISDLQRKAFSTKGFIFSESFPLWSSARWLVWIGGESNCWLPSRTGFRASACTWLSHRADCLPNASAIRVQVQGARTLRIHSLNCAPWSQESCRAWPESVSESCIKGQVSSCSKMSSFSNSNPLRGYPQLDAFLCFAGLLQSVVRVKMTELLVWNLPGV